MITTVARAALAGAGSGAWFGLLVGLIFWIVSPGAVGAVVSGVPLGLAFGAVFAAIAQAVTGGRRDFTSFRTLEAARFDLLVDGPDAGEQALRILSQPALPDDQQSATATHPGNDPR